MKHTKKLFSALLALVMVFTMAVPAFADTTLQDGMNIVVDDAYYGETYNIYKIFDLSYDMEEIDQPEREAGKAPQVKEAYNYTISKDSPFYPFFVSDTEGVAAPGEKYFSIEKDYGTVTPKEGFTQNANPVYQFANELSAWIKDNSIAATATKTHDRPTGVDGTVKQGPLTFENLKNGYYIIDTSVAAVFLLYSNNRTNGTDGAFHIEEKSPTTVVTKTVQEDSNGSYGKENTLDIGQDAQFQSVITNVAKSTNLVVHDTMSKGLTFNNDVKVYLNNVSEKDLVDPNKYTVKTNVTHDDGEVCTFEINFDNEWIAGRSKSAILIIEYSAKVNEEAAIGKGEYIVSDPTPEKPASGDEIKAKGNPNDTYLTYGNNQRTEKDRTTTYTFKIDIFKYFEATTTTTTTTGTGNIVEQPLEGAQFVLFRNVGTLLEPIYEVATYDEKGHITWAPESDTFKVTRVNDGTAANPLYHYIVNKYPENAVKISDAEGKVHFHGLDVDTYYLEEVVAPEGFSLLPNVMVIEVMEDGKLTVNNRTQDPEIPVKVENQTGNVLPTTGGMGTTLFYVSGAALAIGAMVMLVVKRRMGEEE